MTFDTRPVSDDERVMRAIERSDELRHERRNARFWSNRRLAKEIEERERKLVPKVSLWHRIRTWLLTN